MTASAPLDGSPNCSDSPRRVPFSVFWQVSLPDGVDLDFDTYGEDATFTTSRYTPSSSTTSEFDAILGRIRDR